MVESYMARLYNPVVDKYTEVYKLYTEESFDGAVCEANYLNVKYLREVIGIEVICEDEVHDKGYDINKYKIDYIFTEDITPYVFIYVSTLHKEFLTKESFGE